jgi:quercetin dioxygenase-like cupin family protein
MRTRQYGASMESDDVHVAPSGGPLVDLGGLGVQFKVPGEQTGGTFAVVEHPIQPGILVDPHIHRNEDELSYVLEGAIWARVGDSEVEAEAGSYVWKPRGVLHTFWNPGPDSARILEVISPAGFEHLFEEVAALVEHPSDTTEEEVYELCRQYGLTFDRSWLPDIESRFGPMRIV